jgi:GntR family transcriptional regulator/MocR family aminotransferase
LDGGAMSLSLLVELDPSLPEPLYRQLRVAITEAIESGRFAAGELLPSSRALAADLDLSRNTVNMAYQELMTEGFLESIPRVGYAVNRDLRRYLDEPHPDAPLGRIAWVERLGELGDDLPHVERPAERHSEPYAFVVGEPDVSLFPTRAWMRAMRTAMSPEHAATSLGDRFDTDDPLLLEMLCRHVLPARGIAAKPDEVAITMGAQNGLYLVSRALLNEGKRVAVEEPGYPDARHIFKRRGAELVAVPIDDQGVTIPADMRRIDMVAVTPSHQYPTNVTLSVGRRQQLLAQADAQDFLIVEDDYDSEFRYHGRPTPALKALDETGRVIYLGSFSKFLAPGLRLGYVVADAPLITRLRDLRRYMLRHPPGLLQRTMGLMIQAGDYVRSVRRSRIALKDKWERAAAAVERHIPWEVHLPTGGLSLWIPGPAGFDAVSVAEEALVEGVVVEDGSVCYLQQPAPRNALRLGFAGTKVGAIEPGVAKLGEITRRRL